VSELARNTVKHGLGGEMRWETLAEGGRRGLKLTFVDTGPGSRTSSAPWSTAIPPVVASAWDFLARSVSSTTSPSRARPQGHARDDHALEVTVRAQLNCAVSDESTVGAARRSAAQLAAHAGLSDTDKGRLGIVVTELARNITLHSGRGALLIQELHDGGETGVEVLAVDSGPGIDDLERSLTDGYSTAGTSGTGMGAVRRLSSEFDLYTRQGGGAIVMSASAAATARTGQPRIGARSPPAHRARRAAAIAGASRGAMATSRCSSPTVSATGTVPRMRPSSP
jgi:anti-sigma regulatory factor (Ser/Thr protein kinase)